MYYMHPLLVRATPVEKFIFHAEFNNGESRRYDVTPLFKEIPVFKDFERVPGLFEQLRVDVGGHGIVWNDRIDLAAEEVWENGTTVG